MSEILNETVKKYKYLYRRPRYAPNLTEEHKTNRVAFCKKMLNELKNDPELPQKTLYTDEVIFSKFFRFNFLQCYVSAEFAAGFHPKVISKDLASAPLIPKTQG